MKRRKEKNKGDIFGALPALRQAAKDARAIAEATGAPLVMVENGKVVKVNLGSKRKKKAS